MTDETKRQHGGARPGAGRPKKQPQPISAATTSPPAEFVDAMDFLDAVVCGRTPPDPVRVAAAKALLPYQKPKSRAPVASPPPSQLAQREALSDESAARAEWNAKAAAIRARHNRTTKGQP